MAVVDLHRVLDMEPCILASELRFWVDVGENGKDKLVWEFENCGKGMRWINVQSKEETQEIVQRLVWGAGDANDIDSGMVARGRGIIPNLHASVEKNVEVFSR